MADDNSPDRGDTNSTAHSRSALWRWLSGCVRFLLAVVILAAGAALSVYWLTHRPKATRRRPPAQATLVSVSSVRVDTHQVVVRAMGTVVPARESRVAPRVGGEVVEVSPLFVPGGRFASGDQLLRLDPSDYELAVAQQKSELARCAAELEQRQGDITQREVDIQLADIEIERSRLTAEQRAAVVVQQESALKVEQGQQSVAKREYELLGQTVDEQDRELVLRLPQLKAAQADCDAALAAKRVAEAGIKTAEASRRAADVSKRAAEAATRAAAATVKAAEAALSRANLDLERTQVKAPFNALVVERSVDVGSTVTAGMQLASLVGTDEYWVQVSVPVSQLRWLSIPELTADQGSSARVFHEAAWGEEATRTGTLTRLMTELEPQGRMARLLVTVADPLDFGLPSQQRHPLLLGSYVRVDLLGEHLQDVARERTALRHGNQVWVMRADATLDIRDIDITWSGDDYVYVSEGLAEGDLLVSSDLGAPVQGMALRTADQSPEVTPATLSGAALKRGTADAPSGGDTPAKSGRRKGPGE